jgi:pimeloyl-ACP methyl ester carboxylesterase
VFVRPAYTATTIGSYLLRTPFSRLKLVKKSTLKIYPGLPHGVSTTNPEQINADLLAFCKTAAGANELRQSVFRNRFQ